MIRLDKANGGFIITSLESGSDIFIQTDQNSGDTVGGYAIVGNTANAD